MRLLFGVFSPPRGKAGIRLLADKKTPPRLSRGGVNVIELLDRLLHRRHDEFSTVLDA